jgi:hypothetical protein
VDIIKLTKEPRPDLGDIEVDDVNLFAIGDINTKGGFIGTNGGYINTNGGFIYTSGGNINTNGGFIYTSGGDISWQVELNCDCPKCGKYFWDGRTLDIPEHGTENSNNWRKEQWKQSN